MHRSEEKEKTADRAAYTNDIPHTPIRFLAYVSRPHVFFAAGAIITVALAQVFSSLTPFILQQIVDGFTATDSRQAHVDLVLMWGSVYVVFSALAFTAWRLSGFIGMEWLTRLSATAYERLYEYIAGHSNSYFTDRFAGSLSNKISNASDGAENFSERFLWGWFPELIALVIGLVLFVSVDPVIAVAFLAVFIVMAFVNLYLVRKRRPHVVAYAEASSKLRGGWC